MSNCDRKAVFPTDRQLQIDLDSNARFKFYKNRLNFFRARIASYQKLRDWKLTPTVTKSMGGNRHVTIDLSQRMTDCERILAGLLLGDDPDRAMYAFFRYLNGSRFPVLFYERKKGWTRHSKKS